MIQPQSMLELQKLVLLQVSEDKSLFKKELKKSFGWLGSSEIFQLHRWVKENYGNTHHEAISEVFRNLNYSFVNN